MHCLISIVIREWSAVHAEVQAQKRLLLEVSAGADLPRPPIFSAATGCLLVVDWDGGKVLAGLPLPKPTGFLLEDGRLHVALWETDEIVTLQGTQVAQRRQHRFFNHVHTLDRTPRGLLVSSSGSDLLAEIDESGALLWQHFLFQHGYGGTRFRFAQHFDPGRSYNRRYLPAALTTHPNSALRLPDDSVLATLFSTGELLRIDRSQGETQVLLSGLRRPHSIRRRPGGGYMLCDTEGGAVVLLDAGLQPSERCPVPAAWIQDAVLTDCQGDPEGRMLVVANRRIVPSPLAAVDDAGGDNYVLELRRGTTERRLSLGPDSRIYMVEPISRSAAESLAHAWAGSDYDTGFARWETAWR
jgi:hypothetical protein